MQKTCNSCGSEKKPQSVPYIVHESAVSRLERQLKRLWIVILVLIFTLVGFIWYENQFETVETVEEVVIEAEQGDGTNIVGGGDVIYGSESYSKKDDHN